MFAFSRALKRSSCTGFGTVFVKPVLVVSLAALLAACSNTKQPAGPQVFSWLAPEPPPPAPIIQADVELEDDGLPPQADPAAGIRRMPDDPSAPWSRNYGRSAAGAGVPPLTADGWQAETRGAVNSAGDDDGLPPIKSPEEAGLIVQPQPRRMQRVTVVPPWQTCSTAERWKCAR